MNILLSDIGWGVLIFIHCLMFYSVITKWNKNHDNIELGELTRGEAIIGCAVVLSLVWLFVSLIAKWIVII